MRLFVVLFAFFLAGCSGEDDSTPDCQGSDCPYELSHDCANGDCSFHYYAESQLKKTDTQGGLFTSIEEGTAQVFELSYVYDDVREIADDELSVYMRIALPSSVSSFNWRGDVLTNQEIYYARLCFCADVSAKKPYSGTIRGQRLSPGKWNIEADLLIDYYDYPEAKPIRLRFSEVFEEAEIAP
jgi:hypothetical protein